MHDLLERLSATTKPDRELDCRIWLTVTSGLDFYVMRSRLPNFYDWSAPYYTSSLDAATLLVPQGWQWMIVTDDGAAVFKRNANNGFGVIEDGNAATPVLSLCVAALKVHARMKETV